MRNVKAACAHSINLPQLHIYNIFNTGSFLPPWNPGALPRALCNGSGQVHLSVFQGGAESLREPLSPCPYHLNPSLGFRCASLGLALADLTATYCVPGTWWNETFSIPWSRPALGRHLCCKLPTAPPSVVGKYLSSQRTYLSCLLPCVS